MKALMNVSLFCVLVLLAGPGFCGEAIQIERKGIYEGRIASVSECERTEGDKRYCKQLNMELKTGEVVKSNFWLYVTIAEGKKIIYSGPDDGLPEVEKGNKLTEVIKKKITTGRRVRVTTSCGDEGCDINKIELLK